MSRPMSARRFYSSPIRQARSAKSSARRSQSMRQLDITYGANPDWDLCLRVALDYPPATLIHRGRKPRNNTRHTPWS